MITIVLNPDMVALGQPETIEFDEQWVVPEFTVLDGFYAVARMENDRAVEARLFNLDAIVEIRNIL